VIFETKLSLWVKKSLQNYLYNLKPNVKLKLQGNTYSVNGTTDDKDKIGQPTSIKYAATDKNFTVVRIQKGHINMSSLFIQQL
jgi:hypothetical protein